MRFILIPSLKNLHFIHPEWFLLLLVIPLLWLGWRWQRNHQGRWERLVDKPLIPFVLSERDGTLGLLPMLLLPFALLLAIIAMAGPAWEKREVPVFRTQSALVVAMDFSLSMYATDEKPNRLTLARFKLLDILKARQDGQTGLVVFAGDAFMVSPLTDDVATIEAQAKNLSPEIMPAQGSLVAPAVQRSVALLKQAGVAKGHILLMTDGANDVEKAFAAVQAAVDAGYTVSVLAIGSAAGAPIAQPRGGILRDGAGQIVIPNVDLATLQALADAGDGVFAHAALGDADLAALSAQWQATPSDEVTQGEGRQVDTWLNQGYWLVLLLLPLAALAFRRGWLAVVLVCFALVSQPEPTYALDWKSWWQTPDQQGQQALQQGRAAEAAQLFQNREWKAAAAYKSQDYATAAVQYQQIPTLDGQYNYANALAQQGKLSDALAVYDHVLKIEPNHDDARYNRELVKRQLAQQKQQQQQNPPSAGNESEQKPQSEQSQQQQGQQTGKPADSQQQAAEEQAKKAQEQQDAAQQKEQQPQSGQEKKPRSKLSASEEMSPQEREKTQAAEQWLQRIPDDPAGLWRRKFQYQYQQRGTQAKGAAW